MNSLFLGSNRQLKLRMITISFIFYLFSFFQKSATEAQKHVIPKSPLPIPKNYFRSPVDRPFFLAGAFGELRAGHFHSGIDIKSTDGAEGESIHAIGDGYISRISVKPDGYGNGIYITHPNGFTSVYAHLQKFNDAITKIMTEAQIKEQTVNFDFYPDTGRYMVRKGDIIGKMGNSGSSKGTHLHFEIRETDSETPINPFLFGYTIEDREAPRVNYVRLYGLDSNFNEYFGKNILVSTHNKLWVPRQGDNVDFKTDRLGIGINTRDGQEGNWNRNGIYEIKMFVNDSLWYQIRFDSVTFFTTRMINAHLDYPEHKFKKNYVHKCFTLPGNTLGIIKKDRDRGLLQINQKPTKINFEIIDFNRNLAKMQFFVKCSSNPAPMETGLYTYYLPYAQPNLIKTENVEINFPKFSFFTNTPFKYSYSADQSTHTYSGLHHIGDISVPVFGYYDLRILSSSIPDSLKPKAYIAIQQELCN